MLIHIGRSSGKTYRTPLDAHPLPEGYLFIPMSGLLTDWLKNVLAAQAVRLSTAGQEIELESPTTRTPPGISNESKLLRMDIRRQR